jgi:hypothetical protein
MATLSTAGLPFSTGGEAVVNFDSPAPLTWRTPSGFNFLPVKVCSYASTA